ncbi:MAG: hypothetical protein Kow0031_12950 [Anaerolineae bacterium]
MKPTLNVYIAEHCPGCAEARQVAAAIARDYPHVAVAVIDIGQPGVAVPEAVFATPTYLLNGRVVSLGNPGPTDITGWLGKAQADTDREFDGRKS